MEAGGRDVIDDDLLSKASPTMKNATTEEALRHLVRRNERLDAPADLPGLGWEVDPAEVLRTELHRRSLSTARSG